MLDEITTILLSSFIYLQLHPYSIVNGKKITKPYFTEVSMRENQTRDLKIFIIY